jgi:hypothetical protein
MQAVDQKQKSKFDIEISRLWDDDLLDGLSAERWFNQEDFSEGLAIARARYPAPPGRAKPPPKVEAVKPVAGREPKPKTPSRAATPNPAKTDKISQPPPGKATATPPRAAIQLSKPQPRSEALKPVPEVEPTKPVVAKFAMRLESSSAKFMPMWRIRIRR